MLDCICNSCCDRLHSRGRWYHLWNLLANHSHSIRMRDQKENTNPLDFQEFTELLHREHPETKNFKRPRLRQIYRDYKKARQNLNLKT